MTTKEQQEVRRGAVAGAMTTKERGEDTIHVYREELDEETKDAMQKIQQNLEVDFETSYDIMASACDIIDGLTLEESGRDSLLDDNMLDLYAEADGSASIYTSTRLSYLTNWNEDEITSLVKDEGIDSIATACAVWYERKVQEALEALRAYIIGDDNE